MSKSQLSVEYMLIIGFATLLTVPLLAIYYTYTAGASDTVAASQALQIARKIADSAESVYYLGKPSQTTLKMSFPDKIESTNLSNNEIIFKMRTGVGLADIVYVSSVNITGTLPVSQGIHIVTVKAEDGYVMVTSN